MWAPEAQSSATIMPPCCVGLTHVPAASFRGLTVDDPVPAMPLGCNLAPVALVATLDEAIHVFAAMAAAVTLTPGDRRALHLLRPTPAMGFPVAVRVSSPTGLAPATIGLGVAMLRLPAIDPEFLWLASSTRIAVSGGTAVAMRIATSAMRLASAVGLSTLLGLRAAMVLGECRSGHCKARYCQKKESSAHGDPFLMGHLNSIV